MPIVAILSLISTAMTYVPKLIQIGEDVAPLVTQARSALANIGTPTSETAEQFAALDALVAGYESQLQALATPDP
jgi:hypothetical protein